MRGPIPVPPAHSLPREDENGNAHAGTHPRPPLLTACPVKTKTGIHPFPLSSRMRGPIPALTACPVKTKTGIHPHPLSSRMLEFIPRHTSHMSF